MQSEFLQDKEDGREKCILRNTIRDSNPLTSISLSNFSTDLDVVAEKSKLINKNVKRISMLARHDQRDDIKEAFEDYGADLCSMTPNQMETCLENFYKMCKFNREVKTIIGKNVKSESGKLLSGLLENMTGLLALNSRCRFLIVHVNVDHRCLCF